MIVAVVFKKGKKELKTQVYTSSSKNFDHIKSRGLDHLKIGINDRANWEIKDIEVLRPITDDTQDG